MQSCGMARQHFYYHFEDIYDAVRWMFDQEAVALLREHEGVCCGRTACSNSFSISGKPDGLPVRPALLEPGTSETLFSDRYSRYHTEYDPADRHSTELPRIR